MKMSLLYDSSKRPVYSHLEPMVEFLLAHGNKLAADDRWVENRTGFRCLFTEPIDFALIEASFELPPFIRFDRENGSIECDETWASIVGGIASCHA